jgi:hypothetical protein
LSSAASGDASGDGADAASDEGAELIDAIDVLILAGSQSRRPRLAS